MTEQTAINEIKEPLQEFRKCLVVLMGLPLMGKTTLGVELARCSNFRFLDVDDARWEIFPPAERLPRNQEAFAMQTSYQKNHEKARDLLLDGKPVILGATYSRELYHEMLKWLARQTDSPLRTFLLNAPDEVIGQRLKARIENGNPSTVKSLDAFKEVQGRYQLIQGINLTIIDTSLPPKENIKQILSALQDLRAQ